MQELMPYQGYNAYVRVNHKYILCINFEINDVGNFQDSQVVSLSLTPMINDQTYKLKIFPNNSLNFPKGSLNRVYFGAQYFQFYSQLPYAPFFIYACLDVLYHHLRGFLQSLR